MNLISPFWRLKFYDYCTLAVSMREFKNRFGSIMFLFFSTLKELVIIKIKIKKPYLTSLLM